MRVRTLLLSAAVAAAGVVVPLGGPVRAAGEVSPEEDNPPGCTTATGEETPQCGAQGRDHFGNEGHKPPIEACDDVRSEAGSVVTRVLPDGPRHPDGSLAFIPGVCVYLPPNYDASRLRYPTVYLLHGGGGDQADWVTFGNVQQILDAAYAADPRNAVIAVMPDGRSGQWFDYYDRSFLLETYVLDHVVPFIDQRFRTISDRQGRAIAGLSNGGYGAMHFAAKAPDLFVAAGAMSANIGARAMGGLGTPVGDGLPSFQEAGATYYGSLPVELVTNLDHVDLTIDWGATCSSDITVDLCATWGFEQAFRLDNQHFRDQLDANGYTGTYEYREAEGSHAWRWWTKWLAERHLPFFFERLADPRADRPYVATSRVPETFRYRSIAGAFDVFGYRVEMDRPVREFVYLTDVTASGLVIRGSGAATITTASRYEPGRRYVIGGTTSDPRPVVTRADSSGRLSFRVDLGPAHQHEQYTPAARAAEAAGGYWTERSVTISTP